MCRSRPLQGLFIAEFFVFGLVFGSFLNVCIYRMPRGLSVIRPRSACPSCHAPIAAYDNLPVLSWMILRGRCRRCKSAISPRYAAVELLTGLFFVLSYLVSAGSIPLAVKYCVFSFLLIGLVFTDAETKLLPDLLTIPGLIAGLLFSFFVPVPEILLSRWIDADGPLLWFSASAAGAITGAGFILGVAILYKAVRGIEGMGMGDVKLMAFIGAFLGLELTLVVLLAASVIGSIFGITLMLMVWRKRLARRRRRIQEPAGTARAKAWFSAKLIFRHLEIPFGVFLGTAAMLAAFWGMPLVHWYLGLF